MEGITKVELVRGSISHPQSHTAKWLTNIYRIYAVQVQVTEWLRGTWEN